MDSSMQARLVKYIGVQVVLWLLAEQRNITTTLQLIWYSLTVHPLPLKIKETNSISWDEVWLSQQYCRGWPQAFSEEASQPTAIGKGHWSWEAGMHTGQESFGATRRMWADWEINVNSMLQETWTVQTVEGGQGVLPSHSRTGKIQFRGVWLNLLQCPERQS